MAKDYPRSYRVADQIQRELAELIRMEVKDPRVPALVTVAGVEAVSYTHLTLPTKRIV